ncbi:MAG: signal peptidase [Pseudomonadota bacterium]|jgi:signal peptidase I
MQQAMAAITAVLLAALVGYLAAWYAGWLVGNFAAVLMLAVAVCGVYWLAEKWVFLPQRRRALAAAVAQWQARQDSAARAGVAPDPQPAPAAQQWLRQPWWLDWTAGLFPVLLVVFVLRSFVVEPFRIPSGSMVPTLHVGDLILVNKFTYGLRLPVWNLELVPNQQPERGDVVVFRYPPQPELDYIKRVVGLPGDTVTYRNKSLTINGQAVGKTAQGQYLDKNSMRYSNLFVEQLGTRQHQVLNDADRPAFVAGVDRFAQRDQCQYFADGVSCKVPANHYFVMGDNRDNSLDSRYWGFVPREYMVGQAFFVWMNFGDLSRIGGLE